MPGTLPIETGIEALRVRSIDPTLTSDDNANGDYVRKVGAQRWAFTIRWPKLSHQEVRQVMAFINTQRGAFHTFEVVMPVLSDPQGAASGTPLVDGAGQTGNAINTRGWTPSITVLMAGDKVRFNGHSKVYEVTADALSDGTGLAALALYPPLMASPADGEALTVTDVPFTVRASNKDREFNIRANDNTLALDVVEAL
ncbi:hypothetical protein BOW53_03060 [Solemya pervernicosa gill symbiont]|uniref:Uncharacterized protein n=1 Tax=Solemya pervernicosa gill symbiont TaxID=642797 RepID=A0A1T2L996_9GAMM|nr:hypothetical protein [Solemya pervernicosa gill symbiont]OOZ41673.1 hypothetical protein BOW53_03060 [Solemya pervernicosa gill symbiont]